MLVICNTPSHVEYRVVSDYTVKSKHTESYKTEKGVAVDNCNGNMTKVTCQHYIHSTSNGYRHT